VRARRDRPEPVDGVPLFDQPFYQDITSARLHHLAALELPVAGRSVIDVGCGIGRLSEFFVERGCDVLCVDGRSENIAELRRLYPERRAAVVDVLTEQLHAHGSFDVVFCYGLLYHLTDPLGFLRRAALICGELMVVETCITDSEQRVVFLVDDPDDPTMALNRVASRPSPPYVATALRLSGFEHIYSPTTLPGHKDFLYERRNDLSHLRDGNVLRDIFVASRRPLRSRGLRPL
jgi:SAM-dependent methyltransferase